MKKRLTALLAVLTLALACGTAAIAAEMTGNVKSVSGTVSIQRGDASSVAPVSVVPVVGDKIQVKDTIRTGSDGSIGISFVDGTRLSLGPSSELSVQEYLFAPLQGDFGFGVSLFKGTAAYTSGKLGKLSPSSVKITTPQATIGIRGTSFVLKVD